jgi:hypothetical protein
MRKVLLGAAVLFFLATTSTALYLRFVWIYKICRYHTPPMGKIVSISSYPEHDEMDIWRGIYLGLLGRNVECPPRPTWFPSREYKPDPQRELAAMREHVRDVSERARAETARILAPPEPPPEPPPLYPQGCWPAPCLPDLYPTQYGEKANEVRPSRPPPAP